MPKRVAIVNIDGCLWRSNKNGEEEQLNEALVGVLKGYDRVILFTQRHKDSQAKVIATAVSSGGRRVCTTGDIVTELEAKLKGNEIGINVSTSADQWLSDPNAPVTYFKQVLKSFEERYREIKLAGREATGGEHLENELQKELTCIKKLNEARKKEGKQAIDLKDKVSHYKYLQGRLSTLVKGDLSVDYYDSNLTDLKELDKKVEDKIKPRFIFDEKGQTFVPLSLGAQNNTKLIVGNAVPQLVQYKHLASLTPIFFDYYLKSSKNVRPDRLRLFLTYLDDTLPKVKKDKKEAFAKAIFGMLFPPGQERLNNLNDLADEGVILANDDFATTWEEIEAYLEANTRVKVKHGFKTLLKASVAMIATELLLTGVAAAYLAGSMSDAMSIDSVFNFLKDMHSIELYFAAAIGVAVVGIATMALFYFFSHPQRLLEKDGKAFKDAAVKMAQNEGISEKTEITTI